MRILFVEDDVGQIQLLNDAVVDWNGKNGPRGFDIITAPDVEQAKAQLAGSRVDAALFDLRLPSKDGEKAAAKGGNDLAREALAQIGVPIAVISGNPADLDQDLREHQLLERFDKGDQDVYPNVLAWLDGLWSLMNLMGKTRLEIQRSGAEIFVKRLWPRWKEYADLPGVDFEELGQIVSRQYVGHIAENLGIDGADNAPWHPYEAYIRPALLEHRTHTGDIFSIDEKFWVVLTPQCDMAKANVTEVLLAEVDKAPPKNWPERVAELSDAALGVKRQEERDKYFRDKVNQNIGNATHFLPPLKRGEAPLTVKFSSLSMRSLAELNKRLEDRQASVAAAFLPNLVQRFGAYISRTGQPDIAPRNFQ